MENNTEKKSKGVSLATIVCMIIIFILLIVLAVLGFIKEKNIETAQSNAIQTSNVDTDMSINTEELDKNSELVKELYSKILKSNYIYCNDDGEFLGSFYKDKKVTVDDLSNEEKLVAVLQYLTENNKGKNMDFSDLEDEVLDKLEYYVGEVGDKGNSSEVEIYDDNEVKAAVEEIFGNNVNVTGFTIDNHCAYVYEYYDEKYYSYSYPGGGYGIGAYGYSEIQSAEKTGDYIYIYDKFIYREDYPTDGEEYIEYYTDSTKNNSIDKILFSDNNYKVIEDTIKDNVEANNLISKYNEKLNTYKHTFKKDANGNYYWVSTEPYNK